MKVILRPLEEEDAHVSFRWRNDAEIWKYTENKPNIIVTLDIEKNWLKEVLARKNERRFAICIGDDKLYIGNIQLTEITNLDAQLHVFIGKKDLHGKGIGSRATKLLIELAFNEFDLTSVYLFVKKENVAAVKSYKKCGFTPTIETKEFIKMEVRNEK